MEHISLACSKLYIIYNLLLIIKIEDTARVCVLMQNRPSALKFMFDCVIVVYFTAWLYGPH